MKNSVKNNIFFWGAASMSLGGIVLLLVLLLPGFFIQNDSPIARMFRTEADLQCLVHAVEVYRTDLGVYPPPGTNGLNLAVRHLSKTVNYLPDGPPPDAWGRSFHYVPHTHYTEPGVDAVQNPAGGYYAPTTFQLFSLGITEPLVEHNERIINNWDTEKSWREFYRVEQKKTQPKNDRRL